MESYKLYVHWVKYSLTRDAPQVPCYTYPIEVMVVFSCEEVKGEKTNKQTKHPTPYIFPQEPKKDVYKDITRNPNATLHISYLEVLAVMKTSSSVCQTWEELLHKPYLADWE